MLEFSILHFGYSLWAAIASGGLALLTAVIAAVSTPPKIEEEDKYYYGITARKY